MFIALFLTQFLWAIAERKIKDRFAVLGYDMKSEPWTSVTTLPGFWGEARDCNRRYKDPYVSKLLLLRVVWWCPVRYEVLKSQGSKGASRRDPLTRAPA
tara:strand:+ start:596 stop:892 length:297 start_codon:yes stop_codon:yes gene_type:complete